MLKFSTKICNTLECPNRIFFGSHKEGSIQYDRCFCDETAHDIYLMVDCNSEEQIVGGFIQRFCEHLELIEFVGDYLESFLGDCIVLAQNGIYMVDGLSYWRHNRVSSFTRCLR